MGTASSSASPTSDEGPGRHGERRRRIGGDALHGLRLAQEAEGRTTSTIAMIRNSTTRVSLEKTISAPNQWTVPTPMQKALRDADQDGGEEGAADAAQAADHGDDEGVGDDGKVELEVGGLARDLQRAAQPASTAPTKNTEVKSLAWSTPSAPTISRSWVGGAHQRAPARARQQQPHGEQHDRADGDQQQVVGRDAAAQDLDGHGEAGRARADQVLGAPGEEGDVLDHQHDGEGGEQLEQLGRACRCARSTSTSISTPTRPTASAASTTEVQKPMGVRPSAWIRL